MKVTDIMSMLPVFNKKGMGFIMKKIIRSVKDEQLDRQMKEIAILVRDLRVIKGLEIEPIMAYAVWKCISRKLGNGGQWISINDVNATELFMEKSEEYFEIQHIGQEEMIGMSFNENYSC